MAQYLLALLGDRDPLAALLGGMSGRAGMPDSGRMGDYVFSQEGSVDSCSLLAKTDLLSALDQIITQIMENSNAHRPVPATEELVEKLPREVLTTGCTCSRSLPYVLLIRVLSAATKRRLRCLQRAVQS